MSKKISAAFVVLSLLVATPAFAGYASGYVCIAALHPATLSQVNGFGTEGELQVTLYTQPGCTGTQTAYVYFFSIGATAPGTNANYLYTAAELQAIFQAIVTSRNKSPERQIVLASGTTNTTQGLILTIE